VFSVCLLIALVSVAHAAPIKTGAEIIQMFGSMKGDSHVQTSAVLQTLRAQAKPFAGTIQLQQAFNSNLYLTINMNTGSTCATTPTLSIQFNPSVCSVDSVVNGVTTYARLGCVNSTASYIWKYSDSACSQLKSTSVFSSNMNTCSSSGVMVKCEAPATKGLIFDLYNGKGCSGSSVGKYIFNGISLNTCVASDSGTSSGKASCNADGSSITISSWSNSNSCSGAPSNSEVKSGCYDDGDTSFKITKCSSAISNIISALGMLAVLLVSLMLA